MAQADGVVANASGAAVRADINNQLAAGFSNQSGNTAPNPNETYPCQYYADTANDKLKIRDKTTAGQYYDLRTLDGGVISKGGTASAPGIYFGTTTDTGFFQPASGEVALSIDGNCYISIGYDASSSATPNRGTRIGPGSQITSNYIRPNNQTDSDTAHRGTWISEDGFVQISGEAHPPLIVNRLGNDGNLIQFFQGGNLEGSITVSGTTVSYTGAHLSRWSQLPGGNSRSEILRGSVMSNTDEMCEWGSENNEQLNRCKVSEIEGDVDVAGVFQGWDDDDEEYTNDFYIAMTGDFVIRIAQGTTVARGDLLMSAGDGTAKPQGDDIVRSKTVAKVTSTAVSTTYADGSYCVPCVLMAC